ncbi:hypothetical protein [Pontibacter sp. HJ8]
MKKLDIGYLVLMVTLVLSFYLPLQVYGQLRELYEAEEWHYGKIVLATGDSLFGSVMYHPIQDVVQVESNDGAISSFSPVNVSHFVVRDKYNGRPQIFRSLFWNLGRVNTDFKKPVFFEQLNNGTISLIKRQAGVRKSDMGNGNYVDESDPQWYDTSEEVKESYYALLPDGEIVALRNIRRDLLRLFGKKANTVKQFVRSNELDFNKPHELVMIVNYFNTL